MRCRLPTILLFVLFAIDVGHAQIRVVSYNIANREEAPSLRTVLEAMGNESVNGIQRPIDVLLLQEVGRVPRDVAVVAKTLNDLCGEPCDGDVYRFGTLEGGISGGNDRQGVVYRSDVLNLVSETAIGIASLEGQPRQTMRYEFELVGFGRSFFAYNSHYHSDDRDRRFAEAKVIRDDFDQLGGAAIVYAGDFNLQTSSERTYAHLLAAGAGQAFDPLDTPGTWHNQPDFKWLHTQSPVTSERFGGQAEGGMDDRFDFQLVSSEMLDRSGVDLRDGSYHAFGNNGTHAFRGEITSGQGASPQVLEALAMTSDHLPVVADYLPAPIGDSNLDDLFNSGDLVMAFQRGKYESDQGATWQDGNWNGDRRFNSSDLVFAFQDGGYETGPRPGGNAVPEPTTRALIGLGFAIAYRSVRRLPATIDAT